MPEISGEHGQGKGLPFLTVRVDATLGALHLDVSFSLSEPWSVLFGPSGSGKSTILRAIAGLGQRKQASILLHGDDLSQTPTHQRRVALVSQRPSLFPSMTTRQNVLFGIGNSSGQAQEYAEEVLERFHALSFVDRRPAHISGGEQQRIALARAVACRPKLLLLDEPFTGLELALRNDLITQLKLWQQQTGTPILSVTHDVPEALGCADEIIRLKSGCVVAQGSPGSVLAPERQALLAALRRDA